MFLFIYLFHDFFIILGFTFASGMAAVLSVVHILKAGDHVIVMDDIYSGTIVYFKRVASK